MMYTNKEKFESLWNSFVTLVRGKLLMTARKQNLTLPLANLILSEASTSWMSEYDMNGKWLCNYFKENEEKASLIKEILLQEMKFTAISPKKDLPTSYNYIIPALGAGVGFAVSSLCGLGRIATVLSVLAPAVLLYPAVKTYRSGKALRNVDVNVDLYMEQLEKYKHSIVSILL